MDNSDADRPAIRFSDGKANTRFHTYNVVHKSDWKSGHSNADVNFISSQKLFSGYN